MPLDRAKTLLNAEKFAKAGKLAEAITEFKKLADDNPRDMNIVNKLGDLCARAGKNPDAIRYFLKIAEFYAGDGFFLKAIAMYKKVSKLDPANMDCLQRLAGLYFQQGLTIEAKAQYTAVADHFIKAGQYKKAAEIYPRIVEVEPENMKSRMTLAELLARAGNTGDAAREFRHVAQELAKKGMLDEAIKVAQKGSKLVPGNADLMSLALTLTKEASKSPGDMLSTVVEMAKANGDNPRSLALLGEAYLAAGKSADAEKVFRRLQTMADDGPPEVAAALGRYHLSKHKPAEALAFMARAAEGLADDNRAEDGLGLIEEFLRASPDDRVAVEKKASLAERAGNRKAQAEALARLADLLQEEGSGAEALEAARRLQALEPDNARHASLVAKLEAGGGAGPASAPAARPAVPNIQDGALVLEETSPEEVEEAAVIGGSDADTEDLYGPDSRIQEMQEGEEDAEEPEDDDFISEHFTEAEVFVKYGLLEKAKDQLLKILAKHPRHVGTHSKLKEIYYEEGDKDKAVAECLILADIMKSRGRNAEAQDLVNEAIRIDPNNPKIKERAGGTPAAAPAAPAKPAPAPAPKPAAPPPAAKPAPPPPAPRAAAKPAPAPPELILEEASAATDAEPEIEIIADPAPAAGEMEIEIDMDEPAPARPATRPAPPAPAKGAPPRPAAAPKVPEKVEEETPDDFLSGIQIEDGDAGIGIGAVGGGDGAGAPGGPVAAGARDPDPEKLGEVDFYIDQGLFEEARAVLFQLQKQFPQSPEVTARFERANRPAADAPAARPAPAPSGIDLDVERAFGSQTAAMPAATPRASKPRPVFRVEKVETEPDGDFFDLASELDKSLAEAHVAVETADPGLDEAGHSLDDIFKAFKKGVEQQVDAQDYETHYNLGIAYKEMGLVDEAIAEFQYAAKDPARTVECCGILGLCFRDKGMPQLALKWYQKGLDMPGVGEHESAGLRYDIAEVHREQGDYTKAIQAYTEVYGIDSAYRDVAAKIKEMKKLLG